MEKECEFCNKIFINNDKRRKTCSWECRNKRLAKLYKGRIFTDEHRSNISKNHHDVSGSKNPRWIGGVREEGHGYLWEYAPKHKYNVQGYIRQHRLVMEKSLGRLLEPDEVVHHKNRNKKDNRIENLRLIESKKEHSKLHAREDRPRKEITEVYCKQCGKLFWKRNNQIRITKNNYCSRKCYFLSKK